MERENLPEPDKIMELAIKLNTTIDYLLRNSDINFLNTTKKDIQSLTDEETTELTESLTSNRQSILKMGKEKLNMTNQDMEDKRNDFSKL